MKVFPDASALAVGIARAVVDAARAGIAARGGFSVALSGGETPRAAYELLGTRFRDDVSWEQVDVFFTDERLVPADDARSNFAMAREAWLGRVPIPAARVHPIPTSGGAATECARRYEAELRHCFATGDPASPTFDLAIMGIGTDGHTASLFPGDAAALGEESRWVLAVIAPPSSRVAQRITLTLPELNRSRRMLFAASGGKKRDVVARAVAGQRDRPAAGGDRIPASLAHGLEGTEWFVDASAAPEASREV